MQLGPVQLGSLLAAGGMSKIYRGRHGFSDSPIVVKILDLEDGQSSANFDNEVRAMAAMDHRNIVSIFDYGRTPEEYLGHERGSPYLVMSRCSHTLNDVGAVSLKVVVDVLEQLLSGLSHAHSKGVLHLDLKPGNVLYSSGSDLQYGITIVDFGIAVALRGGLGPTKAKGTPRFMAPEQVRGRWRRWGPCTDLYAVGVLAWMMITSKVPYGGLKERPLFRAVIRDELPWTPRSGEFEGLKRWVYWLLAKDPGKRCATAAAALQALRQIGQGELVPQQEITQIQFAPLVAGGTVRVPPLKGLPPALGFRRRLPALGAKLVALRTPTMLGRQRSLEQVWATLRQALSQRSPKVVRLLGEPGLGRTRFLQAVAEAAITAGVVEVLTLKGGTEQAIVKQVVRNFRLQSLSFEDLFNELRFRWPFVKKNTLAVVAAAFHEGSTTEGWAVALADLLGEVARHEPILVLLDDAEQCIPLRQLAMSLLAQEGAAILVLTTNRALGVGFGVALEALHPEHQQQLVSSLVPVSSELMTEILFGCEGSPRAIVQRLIAACSGELVWTNAGYEKKQTTGLVPMLSLPKLASLSEPGLQVCELASVLRGPVEVRTLVELVHNEYLVLEVVDTLIRSGEVVQDGGRITITKAWRVHFVTRAGAAGRLKMWHRLALSRVDHSLISLEERLHHLLACGEVEAVSELAKSHLSTVARAIGPTVALAVIGHLEAAAEQLSGPSRVQALGYALRFRGSMLMNSRRFAEADRCIDELNGLAREQGDDTWRAQAVSMMCVSAFMKTENKRCLALAHNAQKLWADDSADEKLQTQRSYWMSCAAAAGLQLGALKEARYWGERAVEAAPDACTKLQRRSELARINGDSQLAMRLLDDASSLADRQDLLTVGNLATRLGQLYAGVGNLEQAKRRLSIAYECRRRSSGVGDLHIATFLALLCEEHDDEDGLRTWTKTAAHLLSLQLAAHGLQNEVWALVGLVAAKNADWARVRWAHSKCQTQALKSKDVARCWKKARRLALAGAQAELARSI